MSSKNKKVAVAVVADFPFLLKYFKKFYYNLRQNGNFKYDLVVLTSYNLFTFGYQIFTLLMYKNVKFQRNRKIKFTKDAEKSLKNLNTGSQPNRHLNKRFQWHKINLFDSKIKKYDFVLYLDINMTIHFDINPLLSEYPISKLYAKADGFPRYERKLKSQFDTTKFQYTELNKNYNLEFTKYFQTGLLYFDTNIVNLETKKNLINLVDLYPITTTNEQAIMNLYFAFDNDFYEELPDESDDMMNYFYWMIKDRKIRITKQIRTQYK